MKNLKYFYFCASCAAATFGGTAAYAQSAPPQSAAGVPAAESGHTAAAPEGDIVVTARRREESVQSVPVAITAFSQTALERKGISNPFDLNKAVPGLNAASDGGNNALPTFSIRGRGQFYGAASGSVETYFADVPLSSPFQTPTLPAQFFDLQSVQVLKGPQGTLFGRNTTGGAVLFVPQAPTDEFGGYVRLQGGTYNDVQVEGAVNLKLSDKALFRVAGYEWHRKGYSRTLGGLIDGYGRVLPIQRFDNEDVTEVRATLLLRPTDDLTNSTIFTYHTDMNRSTAQVTAYRGIALPGTSCVNPADPNAPCYVTGLEASPRVANTDVDLRRRPSNTFAVVNTTTYALSDNLTLKNIFGYIHAEGLANNPDDADGSGLAAVDVMGPKRPLHNFQLTDELQLQGHAFNNKLEFIVGGLIDLTRQPGFDSNVNIFSLNYPSSSPTVPLGFDEQFRQSHYTQKSVFGSLTLHLTDNLSLSGGVRRSYSLIRERTLEYVKPLPDLYPDFTQGTVNQLSAKFPGWSYNGGLEWRPSTATMLYGGYRRGFKRGGFNARPPSPAQALFGPETVDDYYAGVKQDLGPVGITGHFNIEGFWDIYHGAQRTYLTFVNEGGIVSLATVVNNAQKSTYRGFDMDFVVEAAPWLELSGNYTFVDAHYNKYIDNSVTDPAQLAYLGNPSTNLAVNPVGLVSRNKLSATARFHTYLGDGSEIAFAPSYSYQSKFYFDDQAFRQPNSATLNFACPTMGGSGSPAVCTAPNLNSAIYGTTYASAYQLVDLRVEWNHILGSKIDLAANVNNLLNKTYKTGGAGIYVFGFEAVSFGPPRMVTVEAKVRF